MFYGIIQEQNTTVLWLLGTRETKCKLEESEREENEWEMWEKLQIHPALYLILEELSDSIIYQPWNSKPHANKFT